MYTVYLSNANILVRPNHMSLLLMLIEPALSTSAGSYNYLTFKVLLSFSLSTIIIVIWRLGDEGGLEMRDLQLRSLLCWLG